MTYAGFLLLFLLLPIVILVGFLRKRLLDRRYLVIAGALILVSLLYMAPWDHVAAIWGLWSWENSHTLGIRWWAIPPEEFLFCILEALLAVTLTFAIVIRKDKQKKVSLSKTLSKGNSHNNSFVPSPEHTTYNIIHASSTPTYNERAGRENEI